MLLLIIKLYVPELSGAIFPLILDILDESSNIFKFFSFFHLTILLSLTKKSSSDGVGIGVVLFGLFGLFGLSVLFWLPLYISIDVFGFNEFLPFDTYIRMKKHSQKILINYHRPSEMVFLFLFMEYFKIDYLSLRTIIRLIEYYFEKIYK